MRIFDFNSAIVRLPGKSVVDGLRSDLGPPPQYSALLEEHQAYVAALQRAGLQVEVLPPLEDFPDAIFVEDPALVFPEAAITLRPGALTRVGETEKLATSLMQRFPQVLHLEHGRAEGGDVLVTPQGVIIGLSERTNIEGARGLQSLLRSLGRDSTLAETPPGVLHLKTASSLVDEETILTAPCLAQAEAFKGYRVLTAPEPGGANVLRVNDVTLVGAQFPRTADLLAQHGYNAIPVPVHEITKIDAGLTCMSLRWRSQSEN